MHEMNFCPNCMHNSRHILQVCPACGQSTQVINRAHQLPVNTILNGRYLVGRVIGEGGFGISYIGFDLKMQVKVAVKEYYPETMVRRDGTMSITVPDKSMKQEVMNGVQSFLDEARALARFYNEENIVRVKDHFLENGTAYIVMEYLDGQTMYARLKMHGKLRFDETIETLMPAMSALDRMHSVGIIHRDISPVNIMICSDGKVKLIDFGTAAAQNTVSEAERLVMLKRGFAPIEQYGSGEGQGPWTDVYALAATIYKLITGLTPPESTTRRQMECIIPPSAQGVVITPAQEQALLNAMAVLPEYRTRSVSQFIKELGLFGNSQNAGFYSDPGFNSNEGRINAGVSGVQKKSDEQGDNSKKGMKVGFKALIALASVAVICAAVSTVLLVDRSRSENDEAAATKVERAINDIGWVTMDSESQIEKAEELYESLTDKQQNLVDNYNVLSDARDDYEALCKTVDKLCADIDAIGEVSMDSGDVIAELKSRYDRLHEDDKYHVSNYNVLLEKEKEYNKLCEKTEFEEIDPEPTKENAGLVLEKAEGFMEKYPDSEYIPEAKIIAVKASVLEAKNKRDSDDYEAALDILDRCTVEYKDIEGIKEAIELKASLVSRLKGKEPQTGQKLYDETNGFGKCGIRIKTGDKPVLIKMEVFSQPEKYKLTYIRANSSATITLHDGNYTLKYATGDYWYGLEKYFGNKTEYYEVKDMLTFKTEMDDSYLFWNVYVYEFSLRPEDHKNYDSIDIEPYDF